MICRNCGRELPDLAIYCPSCGVKQFGAPETEPFVMELADPMNSRVIIESVTNQTAAMSAIRKLTGLELSEIRKVLSDLPREIRSSMSAEDAKTLAAALCEAGIQAKAVLDGEKTEITVLKNQGGEPQ